MPRASTQAQVRPEPGALGLLPQLAGHVQAAFHGPTGHVPASPSRSCRVGSSAWRERCRPCRRRWAARRPRCGTFTSSISPGSSEFETMAELQAAVADSSRLARARGQEPGGRRCWRSSRAQSAGCWRTRPGRRPVTEQESAVMVLTSDGVCLLDASAVLLQPLHAVL